MRERWESDLAPTTPDKRRIKRVPKQDPLGCSREKVVATNDVTDRHVTIIHNVGKHEQRQATRLHTNEVLQVLVRERNIATHKIADNGRSAVRRTKPKCATLPSIQTSISAEPVISRSGIG